MLFLISFTSIDPMLQPLAHLPAFALVEPLIEAIKTQNVIVGAPPGAGKSTVLPLALLNSNLEGKVLLMQPRRVVVRSLADFLAKQLDEPVGQTVGYRIKGESKISSNTKLEIITEGILTRMIQQDPELEGIAAIVFDEFHERSIHSDFGLALALEVQSGLREDLRLVVMSATLDVAPLESLLHKHSMLPVKELHTQGRMFPVEVFYTGDTLAKDIVKRTSDAIRTAVTKHSGDILVFLPGQGSINAVARQITALSQGEGIALHRLYGALGKAAQQEAIAPDPEGRRKIILSTNIAETSLTIEGVKVVIDSLWENTAQYHPSSDITQLSQQRISQASAIQRMGRAGRVSAGVCYRLCSKESFERLAKYSKAQIESEDISSFLLDTYAWGSTPQTLALLTLPTPSQVSVAEQKLARVNALDLRDNAKALNAHSAITPYGRQLASIPCQPHLAHMLLVCKRGIDGLERNLNKAMLLAAPFVVALSESAGQFSQAGTVIDAVLQANGKERSQLLQQAKRYARFVGISETELELSGLDEDALGLCIAIAFPMQVGYLRDAEQTGKTTQYKLASGKGAELPSDGNSAHHAQWLAVLEGQLMDSSVVIRAAQPIKEAHLRLAFPSAFNTQYTLTLNRDSGQMEARESIGFFAILLQSTPVSKQQKAQDKSYWDNLLVDAWVQYLDSISLEAWPLSDHDWQWWRRVALAAKLDLPQDKAFDGNDPWPQSLSELRHRAKEGLRDGLKRCHSLKELQQLNWKTALNNGLTWPQQDALSHLLPEKIAIPTGRHVNLDYRNNGDAVISVKMQEMYSQSAPITLANGKVTVVCELLSPAGRPLQTTSDLGTFWQGSYKEIQKEMKGRYPKHYWPDEPANAKPVTGTKKANGIA